MKDRYTQLWARLSLAQQYALASLSVLLIGLLVIGWWVSQQIQHGVIQNTAVSAALYTNSFVAPEIQELANRATLSPSTSAKLDLLLSETPLGKRIPSFKIWGRDGLIIYSSRASIIGQTFPVTPNLAHAWEGKVAAELSSLDDEENALERKFETPLLEIYSPVRERWSDRIIAVAEFYEDATELQEQLWQSVLSSWIITAGVTLGVYFSLFGVVFRGSRTITTQQTELRLRINELSSLLALNKQLHERVRGASIRAVELNERFLRRISAELHDGPAQALSFALLRLDAVGQYLEHCKQWREAYLTQAPQQSNTPSPLTSDHTAELHDLSSIRQALKDALLEIRHLSSGLALPQLDELTTMQVVQRVTRSHIRRTGTAVELKADTLPDDVPLPYKIGIYRFIQEALNNSFRHAKGINQQVSVSCDGSALRIEVSDCGSGFEQKPSTGLDGRLGLLGMRERIESLGGTFNLVSLFNQGTCVQAILPLTRLLEMQPSGDTV